MGQVEHSKYADVLAQAQFLTAAWNLDGMFMWCTSLWILQYFS